VSIDWRIEMINTPMHIVVDDEQRAELAELRRDAERCKRQTEKLMRLRPDRSESYIQQFMVCLDTIEGQAGRIRNAPAVAWGKRA